MAYLLSIAQDRRTKAQFTASNPVLLADQLAIETDSNVATTGDGTTAYLSIRGNTTLSGDDRRSADDVYAGQTLGDGRDEAGGGDALTSINLNVGPAIELRIPLDARWAQILNAGAPAAGEVEANSDADATAVTSITFHKLDAGTNDQSAWFTQMRVGGNLTVRMTNNDGTNASGSPCIYRITAVPTLASDRYTIAVAYVSGQFIGSLPNWYVSYAGNQPAQFYNGTETVLKEAVISGVTDASGRLLYDMSGSPYSWTDVRIAIGSGSDTNAVQWVHTVLTANTGRMEFYNAIGEAAPENTAVTIILKGF